jgi:glutathione synthase/RimK-type ligase-like ATP-grasp enzyme
MTPDCLADDTLDAPMTCANTPTPRVPLQGLAYLMTLAFRGVDLQPLARQMIDRAATDEQDADALMDLSTLLFLQGLTEVGLATQAQALQVRRTYTLPAAQPTALRLLAVMTTGDLMANAPLPFLVEGQDVALTMLYVLPGEALPAVLPPHDRLWIAVSESDVNRPLLAQLARDCAERGLQPLNRPERILRTGRGPAAEVLQGAAGVVMPATVRVDRARLDELVRCERVLTSLLPDGEWPLIIRPVDSHAGHDLERVASPFELSRYLSITKGSTFFLSNFVDYRGADDLYRKYRVVLVDGVPFAGHLGVSSHWMVHYLNAGMTDCADKRAEEAAFMTGFDQGFARRHAAALGEIGRRFGLDYLVIDCAETRAGELLVFEVDPGAVIHSMDPDDVFPYKRPAMARVRTAFRALLAGGVA